MSKFCQLNCGCGRHRGGFTGGTQGPEALAKISARSRGSRNSAWNSAGYRVSYRIRNRAFYMVRIVTGWAIHARAVWVQAHGPIPKGWPVHHDDEDTFNDMLENLAAMTKGQHARLHAMGNPGFFGGGVP